MLVQEQKRLLLSTNELNVEKTKNELSLDENKIRIFLKKKKKTVKYLNW